MILVFEFKCPKWGIMGDCLPDNRFRFPLVVETVHFLGEAHILGIEKGDIIVRIGDHTVKRRRDLVDSDAALVDQYTQHLLVSGGPCIIQVERLHCVNSNSRCQSCNNATLQETRGEVVCTSCGVLQGPVYVYEGNIQSLPSSTSDVTHSCRAHEEAIQQVGLNSFFAFDSRRSQVQRLHGREDSNFDECLTH